jgi:alpha-galactosidase
MFCGKASFADRTKTTAQIMKNFYLAIREAAGDDVLIMGCNTFSHLSAGIMDIQRTGDDTSGKDWERTKVYGINTLAFRMMQHGAFYCVDADCVGVTRDVAWEKNSQWLDVLAKSGTPLFVSIADNGCFTKEVEDAVTAAFQKACEPHAVSRPLDWMTTKTPAVWKSDFGTDTYQWND